MPKRSHIGISSMIVFFSILTIILQFTAYYFFSSAYVVLGMACLALIICSHILLEQSLTYESSFIYASLTLFISVIITFLTYFGKEETLIPYTNILIGIVTANWLIPHLHCILRNLFDNGTRLEHFSSYFRNNSIVFAIFYLGIIVYGNFAGGAFPWAYRAISEQANFKPFWSLATQIEDYLNQMIPLDDIIVYLSSRILIYIPYGFYTILLLRRRPRPVRFFTLLFVPVIIEIFQYFFISVRCDIDDIIYAFLGGLIGALFFHLTNLIFKSVSGRNFLAKDSDYRYSKSSLHF